MKVNRINIYLTAKDRKELNKLKYKYHLSYSTIAYIILKNLRAKVKIKDLETYIHEDKEKYKTSIKPRFTEHYENATHIYTNAIKLYVRNELNRLMDQKNAINLDLAIIHEMEETWEENWNGNTLNRQIPKIVKKNREYYKKILEIE